MLIPIRTDYRLSQVPIVNYLLVGINVGLFIAGYGGNNPRIGAFLLDPTAPRLEQFFSAMFLHAGWAHIAGNMLFLWVFGNAINDRFGHVGYAAFYLAGGVISEVGYVLLSGNAPVLGASGAISAVTGAYLVLFPRARVTLLLVIWWLMPLEVSSLVFLGFQFLFNLWLSFGAGGSGEAGGVAYAAHASGYVYGIVLAAALLAVRLLPRDVYDLLSLWKARQRRASYRRMVAQGYDPFSYHQPRAAVRRPAPPAQPAPGSQEAHVAELRQQLTHAHGLGDFAAAANLYLQLVALSDQTVLPRQQQLDIANQLMAEQRYPQAADAYERLLEHYPNHEHAGDIELMLGLVYGRYLGQTDKAATYLRRAVEHLHDPKKVRVARGELEGLGQ